MNNKGLSNLETSFIILGVFLVALGLFSINLYSKVGLNKISAVNILIQKKQIFDSILSQQQSFINTLYAPVNSNMDCVRSNMPCSADYVTEKYELSNDRIILYDQHGNPFYDGRASNTRGFSMNGLPCNAFKYEGSGSDVCPIGYIISWRVQNPQTLVNRENSLSIIVKLVYNPSDNNPEKNEIAAAADNTNLSLYDVEYSYPLVFTQ